jgi:hypothetical protein
MSVISQAQQATPDTRARVSLLLLGALVGLAWACGLRGVMAEVAGDDSGVDGVMTFGYILLPGVVTGLLLGWAEHLRASGGRPGWRWLALAPLTFTAVLFSEGPLGFLGIFEDGLGGGAIGVPLYGIVGGYALSGRGPVWGRAACGLLGVHGRADLGADCELVRTPPGRRHPPGSVGGPALLLTQPDSHARVLDPAPCPRTADHSGAVTRRARSRRLHRTRRGS